MTKSGNDELFKLPYRVVEKIESGNLIAAIKELREIRGVGLKDAKDLVEEYEKRLANGQPVGFEDEISKMSESDEPLLLPESILQSLKSGNKLEAIKEFRANRGIGLKEAKDLIDAIEVRLNNGEEIGIEVGCSTATIAVPAEVGKRTLLANLVPILVIILFVWAAVNFVEVAGSLIIVANHQGYAKAEFSVQDVEYSNDPEEGIRWGLKGKINDVEVKLKDPTMFKKDSMGLGALRLVFPVGRKIDVWYNPDVTDILFQGRTLPVVFYSPDLLAGELSRIAWWLKFCFAPFIFSLFMAWITSPKKVKGHPMNVSPEECGE